MTAAAIARPTVKKAQWPRTLAMASLAEWHGAYRSRNVGVQLILPMVSPSAVCADRHIPIGMSGKRFRMKAVSVAKGKVQAIRPAMMRKAAIFHESRLNLHLPLSPIRSLRLRPPYRKQRWLISRHDLGQRA